MKALTTVGDVDAFKYFLPRLLELSVEGELPVDREVVFGKIRHGEWEGWAPHEREAIERLAAVIAETFARTEYDVWELDEWVCALGQFVNDLARLLAPLLSGTQTARANLAALIDHNRGVLWGGGQLANAFWGDANPNSTVFADWLRRPDVQAAAAA